MSLERFRRGVEPKGRSAHAVVPSGQEAQLAISCWYVVIESRGQYWVDCEGHALGPYDEIAEATDGAIHAAQLFGDQQKCLQVMVPDGRGHFEIAWVNDPSKMRRLN
jgi:hypothetical protein